MDYITQNFCSHCFTGASSSAPNTLPCHNRVINKQQIARLICQCSCLNLLEIYGLEAFKIHFLPVFSLGSVSFLKTDQLFHLQLILVYIWSNSLDSYSGRGQKRPILCLLKLTESLFISWKCLASKILIQKHSSPTLDFNSSVHCLFQM